MNEPLTRRTPTGQFLVIRALLFSLLALPLATAIAQDRLKTMPGYERYERMSQAILDSVKSGSVSVTWENGGTAFEYSKNGKRYRYDIPLQKEVELGPRTNTVIEPAAPAREGRRNFRNRSRGVARGRQLTSASSPDGQWKAFYRENNLWLSDPRGSNELAITRDGSAQSRTKYGSASWVYGEELSQSTAMWWSPSSDKIAFYRFDESPVRDFYLLRDLTNIQDRLETEAYPKAGSSNPIVDLMIYDLAAKRPQTVDTRNGKPFDDASIGTYVYGVSWSKDGKLLLFHRTNRKQNVLEFCAVELESGKCRVIVHEEWSSSWVENSPPMQFLEDGRRFLWTSDRTGWRNLYLYDLEGGLLSSLTRHLFDVADIVRVDETNSLIYYRAHSGENPMKLQLHCVAFDGKESHRLTDPHFHHSIDFAPDGRHFIDVAQTHDLPPVSYLRDSQGKLVGELARSDLSRFRRLGLRPAELIHFKAADATTELFGLLQFPSNFNPAKKYPLLVDVYAGPGTGGARETFVQPPILAEYGFLVASFDSRGASGRGKQLLDAIYGHLGIVEIDDQAAGVKSLWSRPYLDRKRVGIYGTSYGGTAAALCLLRYPEVFQAACASSPVTDFRNYDTIYTERYMGLPQDNSLGYEAGSLMAYAARLKGRLMLYYGTADDNVHPSNMMQLVQALQRAGKSFDLQVGPDLGHGSLNRERMMEFFIETLILN